MNATTTTTPMAIKRLVSMVGLFVFGGSIGSGYPRHSIPQRISFCRNHIFPFTR